MQVDINIEPTFRFAHTNYIDEQVVIGNGKRTRAPNYLVSALVTETQIYTGSFASHCTLETFIFI